MNGQFSLEFPGANAIRNAFALMGVAEEEIEHAKTRHPEHAVAIHNVFKDACPPAGMSTLIEDVYRAHVRELCERAACGGSPEKLTDAEILMMLSAGSLRAPLASDHAALYSRLFEQITGNRVQTTSESYPGAVSELRATYKRNRRNAA